MTHGVLRGAAVAALLAAFFLQAALSMRGDSPTIDEHGFITSGYTFLTTGQLRLNQAHPPLLQYLIALPLLPMDLAIDFEDPNWRGEPPNQFLFAENFLYANDVDRILFRARIPILLLGVLLGWYVHRWASEMFNPNAGLVALFLYAFCPNLLTQAKLATTDLGITCFFTIAVYHFWAYLRSRRRMQLALCAVFTGAALAAKFTGILLAPVLGILAAAHVASSGQDLRAGVGFAVRTLAAVFVPAAVIVWALYLFPADPLWYYHAMSLVNENHNPNVPVFLMGEYKLGNFPHYFVAAFLLKTPAITLVLLAAALVLWLRDRPMERRMDLVFLATPVVIVFLAATLLADNLGVRYVLPAYPFLYILIASLAARPLARWLAPPIVAAVALVHAIDTASIFPHHMAYFNRLAGGPANGHNLLTDSNLELGQDLKRLKQYVDREGLGRIRLLYPWLGKPEYHGLDCDEIEMTEFTHRPIPGVYAMSTHALIIGRYWARKDGFRSDWLDRYEPMGRVGYSFWLYRFE